MRLGEFVYVLSYTFFQDQQSAVRGYKRRGTNWKDNEERKKYDRARYLEKVALKRHTTNVVGAARDNINGHIDNSTTILLAAIQASNPQNAVAIAAAAVAADELFCA